MTSSPSKISEPEYDYEALEASYRSWIEEAEETRAKRITQTRARLAASGVRFDSQVWSDAMEEIEADFNKQMQEIENTETRRILSEQGMKEASKERSRPRYTTVGRGPDMQRVQVFKPGDVIGVGPEARIVRRRDEDIWGGGPGDLGISAMGAATAI